MNAPAIRAILAAACYITLVSSMLRADVIAHWTFDEAGGNALEATGRVNQNGALLTAVPTAGITQNVSGMFGGADGGIRFDGAAGHYLTIPMVDGIHHCSYTLAAWVKPADTGINTIVADWADVWAFRFWLDSVIGFNHRYASGADTYAAGAGTVQAGIWQHVAVTWHRPTGTARIYLNGVVVQTVVSAQAGANLYMVKNNRDFHIGWKQDGAETFNGDMDELWIFNEALTGAQVATLMNNNTAPLFGGRLGIDFQGNCPTAMSTTEWAGATNVYQRFWQTCTGASGTLQGLYTSEGRRAAASVQWAAADGMWQLGTSDDAGNSRMMKGYLENYGDGGADTTVTVTGIPSGWKEYDVYVYSDGDNGVNWRNFGASVTDTDGNTLADSGEDSEDCDFEKPLVNYKFQHPWPGGAGNGAFTYGPNNDEGNYVRLSGFTGRSFTLTVTAPAGNGLRGSLNGLQVVATNVEAPSKTGAIMLVR